MHTGKTGITDFRVIRIRALPDQNYQVADSEVLRQHTLGA